MDADRERFEVRHSSPPGVWVAAVDSFVFDMKYLDKVSKMTKGVIYFTNGVSYTLPGSDVIHMEIPSKKLEYVQQLVTDLNADMSSVDDVMFGKDLAILAVNLRDMSDEILGMWDSDKLSKSPYTMELVDSWHKELKDLCGELSSKLSNTYWITKAISYDACCEHVKTAAKVIDELIAMGVEVGTYDIYPTAPPKQSLIPSNVWLLKATGCKIDDKAMAKLDPLWGEYIWGKE